MQAMRKDLLNVQKLLEEDRVRRTRIKYFVIGMILGTILLKMLT